ncbi:Methyltransferase-like protein 9 [Blomia tropicalis]|nr:Methyltransferase-like protein 9 [Blomia tropicalis]
MYRRSLNGYLIERLKRENELKSVDKTRWYTINNACLSSTLSATFHQLSYDSGTDQFISNCYTKANSIVTTFFYAFARTILGLFMSSTSVCGFLGRGSMFVLSNDQFKTFVIDTLFKYRHHRHNQHHQTNNEMKQINFGQCLEIDDLLEPANGFGDDDTIPKFDAILDLGAGDGNVTSVMAPYFNRTYVTEMSRFMQSRLRSRGYHLLDAKDWQSSTSIQSYDLICLLNVLDRCSEPLNMLADIHCSLKQSNGLFLLAVVFPLYQYVEYNSDHLPSQTLEIDGATFEHQVSSFYGNVLQPAGFELIKWTKLPYLCEGNLDLTYFWLIDAVFLLKAI